MNSWWGAAAFIVAIFALIAVAGNRQWNRMAAALRARRPNPTRGEFLALLADTADAETAEFLWDELKPYWTPGLTPHPDDDFLKDLPIDDEEPDDWLKAYCDRFDRDWRDWPHWDAEHPTTVRNFARWLADGRLACDAA